MRYRVICHIDRRVRKRFNNKLLVPRNLGSKAIVSGATPFLDPFKGFDKCVFGNIKETLKFSFINEINDWLFPVFISVFKEPLITESHNTNITRSRNNFLLGFIVNFCLTIINHLLSDSILHVCHLRPFKLTNDKHSFIKSIKINLFLSFFKLLSIGMLLYLVFIAGSYC
jgi:hypothetical protein